jgi:hypothetical protein
VAIAPRASICYRPCNATAAQLALGVLKTYSAWKQIFCLSFRLSGALGAARSPKLQRLGLTFYNAPSRSCYKALGLDGDPAN